MSCQVNETYVFGVLDWFRSLFIKQRDNFIKFNRFNNIIMGEDLELTANDWLLIFLKLNDRDPIKGRLMFVKMLFVANKEVLDNKLDKVFNFYPDKHGPYSKVFAQSLLELKNKELIAEKLLKKDFSYTYTYNLTEKGDSSIKNNFDSLDKSIQKRLSLLKKAFLEQGYMKVLRYVYQKYSEYTTASLIKENIPTFCGESTNYLF